MTDQRHPGRVSHIDRAYFGLLIGLADLSRRYSAIVIAAALALSGAALYYTVTHFAISTNMSRMLSQDLPFERAQVRFNRAFPGLNRTLLVVVHSRSSTLAREDADRLAAWLKRRGRGITSVTEPGGGRFFAREGLLYLSTKRLWRLSDRLSRAQPFMATLSAHPTLPRFTGLLDKALRRARTRRHVPGLAAVLAGFRRTLEGQEQGRYEAMPWGRLMTGSPMKRSAPGDSFIVVKPRYDYRGGAPVRRAMDSIRDGARDLHFTPGHGVTVRTTGSAALDNEQVKTVSQSAGLATALSLTLVLAMLTWGLRRARYVLIILATLFMGLTWTAAFALYSTGPLNLISVSFAVLFVGLGVDFGIQFCIRYQEERTHNDNAQALSSTARRVGSALSLAAISAAISFYSFVPTSYAGIVDLGVIAGTGMFFALLANLTVTPALLTVFAGDSAGRPRGSMRAWLARFPGHRYPRATIAIAVIVAIGLIPLILASRFDFDPMHLQNPHSEAVATFESLLKNRSVSPYPIDILTPNLPAARALAARLRPLKTVSRVITAASFVPAHQAAKLSVIAQMALIVPPFSIRPGSVPAPPAARIRHSLGRLAHALATYSAARKHGHLAHEARALMAVIPGYRARFGRNQGALQVLQRRLIGTLPWQLKRLREALRARPVSLATLPVNLKREYLAKDGRARVEVLSSLNLERNVNIQRFVRSVTRIAPNAVGPPILLVQGGRAVVSAFREASAISFVLITIVLLLTLRSLADAVTILIPLGFGAMAAVAVMWGAGISFNLANIIVLPLLIGLSVAFSIYLVVRWRGGARAPASCSIPAHRKRWCSAR